MAQFSLSGLRPARSNVLHSYANRRWWQQSENEGCFYLLTRLNAEFLLEYCCHWADNSAFPVWRTSKMPEVNSNDAASNDSVLEPIVYVPGQTTLWNESWRELYDKLGDVILLYARQGGLNEHSAHDVLQEVMVTVMRAQRGEAAGHDPAKGSFRKWLKGVVHNRIRSVRRRDQRENPLPPPGASSDDEHGPTLPEVPQLPADIEDMDEHQWQRAILAAALQRLRDRVSPENFAVFVALLEEKASPEQLAKAHGKKTNNIYRIKNSCQTMIAAEAKVIQEAWGHLRQVSS